MTLEDARKLHADLISQVTRLQFEYFVLDEPTVSDHIYDEMLEHIYRLEEKHPELPKYELSIGGLPTNTKFNTVQHNPIMTSLAKVNNYDDLYSKFIRGHEGEEFVVEPKLDGLAVSLFYAGGHLMYAATRGNGWVGEDITHTVMTIKNIPKVLGGAIVPQIVEIRGEIVMPIKGFHKLNDQLVADGLKPFSHPRNAAAGSVRLHDPLITDKRPLAFYPYQMTNELLEKEFTPKTYVEQMSLLEDMGFDVIPYRRVINNFTDLQVAIAAIGQQREKLPMLIDGVVIKFNGLDKQRELYLQNPSNKNSQYGVAFKYPTISAQTELIAVRWFVGRTGVLTPVAEVKPVIVDGVTIQFANLYNMNEIHNLGLMVGDTVNVTRINEVIPRITSVAHRKDTVFVPVEEPTYCPCCRSEVKRTAGNMLYCTNNECSGRVQALLKHFVSKDAMNIKGIDTKWVIDLYNDAGVRNFLDLIAYFNNPVNEWRGVIRREFKHLNKRPLEKVIFALGIPNVGKETAFQLALEYESLHELIRAARANELLPTFTDNINDSIKDYFSNEDFAKRVANWSRRMCFKAPLRLNHNGPLNNTLWVISGKFKGYTKAQLAEEIAKRGGVLLTTVSKKATHLLVGDKSGQKLKQAQDLNMTIVKEHEFQDFLAKL